ASLPATGLPLPLASVAFSAARSFQTFSISSAPTRPYSRGRGGISDVSTASYEISTSSPVHSPTGDFSHLALLASNRSHHSSASRRRAAGSVAFSDPNANAGL